MPRASSRVTIMQHKKKWIAYDKKGYVIVISKNKKIVEHLARRTK